MRGSASVRRGGPARERHRPDHRVGCGWSRRAQRPAGRPWRVPARRGAARTIGRRPGRRHGRPRAAPGRGGARPRPPRGDRGRSRVQGHRVRLVDRRGAAEPARPRDGSASVADGGVRLPVGRRAGRPSPRGDVRRGRAGRRGRGAVPTALRGADVGRRRRPARADRHCGDGVSLSGRGRVAGGPVAARVRGSRRHLRFSDGPRLGRRPLRPGA